MSEPYCPQCLELWREYARATVDHNRLIREYERAAKDDIDRFRELDRLMNEAGATRAAARNAIQVHTKLAHATRSASA